MQDPLKNIAFDCIWNRDDRDDDRRKVKDLWRRYGALEEGIIERRAREIVFVIKDPEGDVVGVSTVRSIQAKFLNNHFLYEYRCFISPDYRIPGMDTLLSVKTKAFLELQEGSLLKHKGILMIIENPDLKKAKTLAVWPASEMVFVGYTTQGHHIRVGYFKGAKLDH